MSSVSISLISNWKTKLREPGLLACGGRLAGSRSVVPELNRGVGWQTRECQIRKDPERPDGKNEAIARCYTVSQRPHQESCFLVSNHLGCSCEYVWGTQKNQIWVLSSRDSQARGRAETSSLKSVPCGREWSWLRVMGSKEGGHLVSEGAQRDFLEKKHFNWFWKNRDIRTW